MAEELDLDLAIAEEQGPPAGERQPPAAPSSQPRPIPDLAWLSRFQEILACPTGYALFVDPPRVPDLLGLMATVQERLSQNGHPEVKELRFAPSPLTTNAVWVFREEARIHALEDLQAEGAKPEESLDE